MQIKMKVLYIITRLDRGGSAEVVLDLCSRMKNRGHDVVLVYGKTIEPVVDLNEYTETSGVKLLKIDNLQREVSVFHDLKASLEVRKIIKNERPEIVRTHTSKAGIIGRWAAWKERIPVVVHTPHGHIFYGYYGKFITRLFILLEKWAARRCHVITTLTRKGLDDHVKAGIAPEMKFRIVPSGIDTRRFGMNKNIMENIRNETGLREGVVIGWVGRFEEVKDPLTFIKAAAIISKRVDDNKDIQFLMAGEGSLHGEIESSVRSFGIADRFVLTGEREDIHRIYPLMDVFVLSSINEGQGRVIIEAMASNIPVVATDVGGVGEIVHDNETGLLVPPSNPERLAESILKVVNDDELKRKLVSENSKQIQSFDIETMVDKFEEIYNEFYGKTA